MVLRCGVGLALLLSKGPTPQAYDSLTEARALSESLDDTTCRLRATYGLWLLAIRTANFPEALAIAREYGVLAATFLDGVASPMAGHMLGISRFCLGENASAAVDLEQASAMYAASAGSGDAIHLGVDLRPITLCYQAITYWLLGFAEKSLRIGQQAIEEAHIANHRVSLCIVLGLFSSIVLVRIGSLETAERCIDEITDIAEQHSLVPYQALGLCAKGSLLVARGDSATADQLLDRGLARMREVALSLYTTIFLSERASVLGSLGQIEKGLAEIEVAEFQAAQSNALWCMPEVLRVKGELLVRHGGAKDAEVEQCFLQSIDWARRQKALSWELRTSISMARFWRDRDRAAEASELLSRVYRRFTEGFETTDLQKAKALLDALA
jgi:non-specific serine/threonine protein kinase